MKRFFALLMTAALLLCLTACGDGGEIKIDSALEHRVEEIVQDRYAYYLSEQPGFLISAVKIHGAYRQNGITKVFVTAWTSAYSVEGDEAQESSGSVVPATISFRENLDGGFEYKEARDGGQFASSIRQFCRLPSGRTIRGLAQKIIDYYHDRDDLSQLHQEKLDAYLAAHGLRMAKESEELPAVPYTTMALPVNEDTSATTATQSTSPAPISTQASPKSPKTLLAFDPAIGPGPISVNQIAERFGEPRLPGFPRELSRGATLVVLCEGIQLELNPPDLSWCYEPELVDRALPMKLYSAIVSGEKFLLPRGIRIGDSIEKVRAAYLDPPHAEPETSDGGMRLVYRYPSYDLGYTFNDGHLTYLLVTWDHMI